VVWPLHELLEHQIVGAMTINVREERKEMRKKTLLPFGLLLALTTQILLVSGATAAGPAAQWTFMIYVCADNNLESSWAPNLAKLEGVGSTSSVNFVALVDLKSTETVELIHIEQGSRTVIATLPEQDMGDPAVAINFVNTAKSLYPASKYLLDFWDHGNGWDYFCFDETANDWLDVPKLSQIMHSVGFIDIVGFDACDMAQAEVYYELIGHSSYVVGSEESIPLIGWPYDTNAQDLVNNPSQDARTYANELVVNYGELYSSLKGYGAETFSAIDINQIPALTTAFTTWTTTMQANLAQYKNKYTSAIKGTNKMWATTYYLDMYDYMNNLLAQSIPQTLVTATQNVKTAIANAVIANWYGKKQSNIYGLTFYWAKANQWTSARTYYLAVTWGQTTGWTNFLDAYCA
jgi:hypothetical protein